MRRMIRLLCSGMKVTVTGGLTFICVVLEGNAGPVVRGRGGQAAVHYREQCSNMSSKHELVINKTPSRCKEC